jgi:ER membrane protein complex subunit 3
MAQQMAMSGMASASAAQPFAPGQDPDKMFLGEAENLEVTEHQSILEGIETRLLADLMP